ncbi:MAG: hypothetical protein HY962_07005 [Ignavibacteriae bacterium]|nr:hypothetical protein [Ignavibacteriota bacterium]
MPRHTDDLIAEGVELTRRIAELRAQLYLVTSELEPRFPAQKTHEEIESPAGRAVRTVRREYMVAPGRLADLRALLGTAYAHMISEEYPMTPTRALLDLIKDERSMIGQNIRRLGLVVAETKRPIVFRAPNGGMVVGDAQAPISSIGQILAADAANGVGRENIN